jgi:uncharacterized membrane protein
MSLKKDIAELRKAGVINEGTAEGIEAYYKKKESAPSNRLLIVFGILGAILVGLGIVLIIAHNWDELPVALKSGLAFLPLVIGQIACAYTLLKKPKNQVWRESASSFLFFTIGASISLISQIYHIPGELDTFLLTWMLLALPLIYVMRSSAVALLYLIGITYYALYFGYFDYPETPPYYYCLLLAALLPHYLLLIKKRPQSNFVVFLNWLLPISLIMVLGSFSQGFSKFIFLDYSSLFGVFFLLGGTSFFQRQHWLKNGYKIIGLLGNLTLLMVFSFDAIWGELRTEELNENYLSGFPFIFAALITLIGLTILFWRMQNKDSPKVSPLGFIFLVFAGIFSIGLFSVSAVVLTNVLILAIGVFLLWRGINENHLGVLNLGLSIVAVLVICRFFDTDLNFVLRGIMFLIVGLGFFFANYKIFKSRKNEN